MTHTNTTRAHNAIHIFIERHIGIAADLMLGRPFYRTGWDYDHGVETTDVRLIAEAAAFHAAHATRLAVRLATLGR